MKRLGQSSFSNKGMFTGSSYKTKKAATN